MNEKVNDLIQAIDDSAIQKDIEIIRKYECCKEHYEACERAIKALEAQSCEDCISRKATIDAIYKKHVGGKDAVENAPINDLYACGLEEAVDAVENMPPVTPQRKRGKWLWELAPNGWANHICSECGFKENTDIHVKLNWRYCPKCGARMIEVRESEDKE